MKGAKKSLKIPKEKSKSVNRRRTDNTMAKTKYKRTNNDLYNIRHKTQNKDKQSKKHNTNK